MVAASGT